MSKLHFLPTVGEGPAQRVHFCHHLFTVCPCCGAMSIPAGGEGTAYICPVCWWEMDVFLTSEDEPSDQNHGLALREARENYRRCGAVIPRLAGRGDGLGRFEEITVGGERYTLAIGYRHHAARRAALNALCTAVWGFDFSHWYALGYWGDNCIPYTLFAGEEAVSHITVSIQDLSVGGKPLRAVQLGTVMTAEPYRGRGLSRLLLERVLFDWEEACDLCFLYANETVYDFYPRFGFAACAEQGASAPLTARRPAQTELRRLDLSTAADRDLLYRYAAAAHPLAQVSLQWDPGLALFYAAGLQPSPFAGCYYHLPALESIAVAEQAGETLLLQEVYALRDLDWRTVAAALAAPGTHRVELGFLPTAAEGCTLAPLCEEDSRLYVRGPASGLFLQGALRFPMLAHT